jgi:hypothetical protein
VKGQREEPALDGKNTKFLVTAGTLPFFDYALTAADLPTRAAMMDAQFSGTQYVARPAARAPREVLRGAPEHPARMRNPGTGPKRL